MSPSDIEILIHYYVSPSVHPRIEAPAVKESVYRFVVNEVLEEEFGTGIEHYNITEKGKALITLLCRTELPTSRWVDSDGKVIELN